MTLQSLFPVDGFSHGAPLSAVRYSGGNFLSALSLAHKKSTATRVLKSNESHGRATRLSDLYGSPTERDLAREKAVDKATRRHGKTSAKLLGSKNRVPVSRECGYMTGDRFFANTNELREKGVFVKKLPGDVQNPGVDPTQPASGERKGVRFTVKLQSYGTLNKSHSDVLLSWLKEHPLLVLDPGMRWVVAGILCRLTMHEVGVDGSIKLEFAYRISMCEFRAASGIIFRRTLWWTAFWSKSWRRPFVEPWTSFRRKIFFVRVTRQDMSPKCLPATTFPRGSRRLLRSCFQKRRSSAKSNVCRTRRRFRSSLFAR